MLSLILTPITISNYNPNPNTILTATPKIPNPMVAAGRTVFLQRVRIACNAHRCISHSILSVRPSHFSVLSRRMNI